MDIAETVPTILKASDALADVCRQFRVRRLVLFGSAATGREFDPARGDLDFLVTFEELGSHGYLDAYFGLYEALEVLSSRRVGLLTEDSIKNPYLMRGINSERRALFPLP